MRLRLAALCVLALVLPLTASGASPFKATFTATTHTPKINAKWTWTIRVTTAAGKPLAATISAQVIDPVGGVHPVEYGCCAKKFVTNVKIVGRFSDYVQYPLAAKGFRLVFRVIVKTRLGTKVVQSWLKPR